MLGTCAFFCFFALGGVVESTESSSFGSFSGVDSSSSESGFGRFFKAAGLTFDCAFKVVCAVFFDGAFAAVAFLGAALEVVLVLVFYSPGQERRSSEIEIVILSIAVPTFNGSGTNPSEISLSSKTESTIEESIL